MLPSAPSMAARVMRASGGPAGTGAPGVREEPASAAQRDRRLRIGEQDALLGDLALVPELDHQRHRPALCGLSVTRLRVGKEAFLAQGELDVVAGAARAGMHHGM